LHMRSKRHPREVSEHTAQGSDRSKPGVDGRSTREESVNRLSGVLDWAHFEVRLGEEFERARRFREDLVLIFFDIDEFARLNDAHGRQAGNDALMLVTRALRSNIRSADVVARYGSDEFLVLMPGTSLVGARDYFEKIRAEVAGRSMLDLGFTVRLSAGAVKLHHDGAGDPRDLLETAEHTMYRAKREGKDRLFVAVAVGNAEDGREAEPEA
jgi:two-component system cell cycle response regulator